MSSPVFERRRNSWTEQSATFPLLLEFFFPVGREIGRFQVTESVDGDHGVIKLRKSSFDRPFELASATRNRDKLRFRPPKISFTVQLREMKGIESSKGRENKLMD